MSAYEYTSSGWVPTLIISGVDVRKSFGVQSTAIDGRYAIKVKRATVETPNKHGVKSNTAKSDTLSITVSGWMDKTKVELFRLLLFSDSAIANKFNKSAKYLQFLDFPKKIYIFDTVEDFSITPTTKQWYSDNFCNFSFTVVCTSGLGDSFSIGSAFEDTKDTLASFEDATNSPAFLMLPDNSGGGPSSDRGIQQKDYKLTFGFSTNPRIVSAETGAIIDFSDGLTFKNTKGVDTVAQLFAPTNLITNGDFQTGSLGSNWSGAADAGSSTNTVTGNCTPDGIKYYRPLTGVLVAKLVSNGSGSYAGLASQTNASLTSGVDYLVMSEILCAAGSTAFIRVYNPSNSLILEKTINATNWSLLQFTFRCAASGTHTIRIGNTGANGTVFFNRIVVAKSVLSNGSVEAGGTTNWSISGLGLTISASGTQVKTGSNSLKATFSGAQSSVIIGTLPTANSGKCYYVTGYAYRESGTRDLVINSDGSATPEQADNLSYHKLETGQWIRFSTFYYTRTTNGVAFKLQSSNAVGTTVIYFDDIAVVELTARTNGMYFEVSQQGKMLQIPNGEVLRLQDYTNQFGNTIVGKYRPHIVNQGSSTIFRASNGIYNQVVLVQNSTSTDSGMYGVIAENRDSSYFLVDGLDNLDTQQFSNSRGDGLVYFATRLSASKYNSLSNTFNIYYGALSSTYGYIPSVIKSQGTTNIQYPGNAAYDTILIGDVGAWSMFYVYQYDLSDATTVAACMSQEAPKFRNRIMTYNGSIGNNQQVIIDTETMNAELVTNDPVLGFSISNAYPNISGDIPEFFGEKAVLFSDTAIRSIKAIGRIVQ